MAQSDRSPSVLRSLQALLNNGRLAVPAMFRFCRSIRASSIQAGASFAPNPQYFDPENIVKLAIEGGCNGVASTFGVLGSVARKYAHKIPFIVKINHNELLTLPNKFDQVMFGTVKEAHSMGAIAVGATIYFGSDESTRQITEIAEAFAQAHELGMACILWCYLRNSKFKTADGDMHAAADLHRSGQSPGRHAFRRISSNRNCRSETAAISSVEKELGKSYGKTSKLVYEKLTTDNPIDLVRYQVANGYMGRIGLINSGGESKAPAIWPQLSVPR